MLNYCGIKADQGLITYVVDRSPHKQDHLLPGSHIPIHAPEKLAETKPDYVIILPWNLKDEVTRSVSLKSWGGEYVVAIPKLTHLA